MASALRARERIEAVFFDLDDTLVDARGAWRAAFAATIAPLHAEQPQLRALGTPQAIYDSHFRRFGEEAHRAAGGGEWQDRFTDDAFERLIEEAVEPNADLARRLADRYRRAVDGYVRPFADARETLEAVGARYRMALISNGPSHLQRPKLDRCGFEHLFERVVISGEVGVQKPDPAIFRLALEHLGVTPGATVYVGDNPHHDVVGACNAGMAAIWVNRGDWPPLAEGAGGSYVEVRALAEVRGLLGVA